MSEKNGVKCFCCAKLAWVRVKDSEDVVVPFCYECFCKLLTLSDKSVTYALQGLQQAEQGRYKTLGIPMAKDAQ